MVEDKIAQKEINPQSNCSIYNYETGPITQRKTNKESKGEYTSKEKARNFKA